MKFDRLQLHCGRGGGQGEVDLLGHRRTGCGWRWRVVLEWWERQGQLPVNVELTALYDEIFIFLPLCK